MSIKTQLIIAFSGMSFAIGVFCVLITLAVMP